MHREIIYLSKKGMKELKKSIEQLERDRKNIIVSLHSLDKGEGHDERLGRIEKLAEYEMVEGELADKKRTLDNAELVPRSNKQAIKVVLGSVVDLIDTSGRVVRYTLVDSMEANPSDGRISIKSPLGKTLMDKRVKDIVEWTGGLTTRRSQLIKIA